MVESPIFSKECLHITFGLIRDGVIAADREGRVTMLNPVASYLTGWEPAAAIGKQLTEVFRITSAETCQSADDPARRALANERIVGLVNSTALLSRDGTERQIVNSSAPISDAQGVVIGVVQIFRDVTAEIALQERVRQSQKMVALGELAGGICHDFNNMLGGILGAADLLRRSLNADDRSARYVTLIQESAARAAGLTTKLLAFTRRQSLVPDPIDVHQAIAEAVNILRCTIDRRIAIEVELTPGPATILGDLGEMEGVFLNLGINAAQAMPEGGRLSYRSRRTGSGQIEITVADTGSGIAPQHLHLIFEPFFTTKGPGKGTGLGLSASLATVQQGGGTMVVSSTVGIGSTFRITLPLTETQAGSQTATVAVMRGIGLILVVDDEIGLRMVYRDMLESCGYHVLEAENGSDAIDLVHTLDADIELVILDEIMPVMSCRDCFARLQQARPGIRVLLASGDSHADEIQELRRHGLAGVITKPFHMAELSQAVAAALHHKTAESDGDAAGPRRASWAS
jgi:PAS domain S-box-containing protein